MTNQDIDELANRIAIRLDNIPRDKVPCVICKKRPQFLSNGYILPFASEYDGEYVCENCLIKALDPLIK